MSVLVLGLGNVLCGDDGAGVVAVHRLQREWHVPEGVEVLDGGTLGLSLLAHLEGARRVILVDAIRADAPPGSFVRLSGEEVAPAARERLSPHQIGVADLLDSLELLDSMPEEMVLLGVVPQTIELGLGLSPGVAAAIPVLVERVAAELERLGCPPAPRVCDAMLADSRVGVDADRALGL